jgi:hypothetical protein
MAHVAGDPPVVSRSTTQMAYVTGPPQLKRVVHAWFEQELEEVP